MKKIVRICLWMGFVTFLHAQQNVFPLWPEGVPCANDLKTEIEEEEDIGRVIRKVHEPEITAYLPSKATSTGTGIVICPGGGYTVLAWDWEGTKIAEWFQSMGVAAFILKYRLPHWESETCRDRVALMDVQRAIRTVRSRAGEWNLDPRRIGVMGFSAGGHLASTAATHFEEGDPKAAQIVDRQSSRPDFAILMYPVITMDTAFAHMGSRTNLLGKAPPPKLVHLYSNEKQISENTPPTLLIHADDDEVVVPENSVQFYRALRRHGVSAALHIYSSGGHGFSLAEDMGAVSGWPDACRAWMREMELLGR